MSRRFALMVCSLAVLLVPTTASAQVGFTTKPKVLGANGKRTITFAVNKPTDVEVAVLDAKGKVVRHLAAGVLGGKTPPPPPLKPGLVQSVEWDGKDDDGKAVSGRCTARVRLGLKARLDRVIGWSGQKTDLGQGLACGPDGTLYLVHGRGFSVHRQTILISAYDRDGKYLRQVFPGPANLPPEKRKGWPRVRMDNGTELPVVFHVLTRTTYPGAFLSNRTLPAVTGDGRLVMLSGPLNGLAGRIKHPDVRGGRRLLILGTDGSVPENFLGPVIAGEKMAGFGHVALSPDDRIVYVAGLFEGGKKGRGRCNVVWRLPLDGSEKPRVFVGKLYVAGQGKTGLNDPRGMATDKDGNLYVADHANNRIAVFKPDGSFLAEVPVARPDHVRVSRRTGAIYVMCLAPHKKKLGEGHWYTPWHNWRAERIAKFKDFRAAKETASLPVPPGKIQSGAFLALDDSASPPTLWYTGLSWRVTNPPVLKIADRGNRLDILGDPIHDRLAKGAAVGFFRDLVALGDRLFVGSPFGLSFDAISGAPRGGLQLKNAAGKVLKGRGLTNRGITSIGGHVHDMASGADGRLYILGGPKGSKVSRFNSSGTPAPFPATGKQVLTGFHHGHLRSSGLWVTRSGNMYLPVAPAYRKLSDMKIKLVGRDGKIKNDSLIRVQDARIGGLAVDATGNIYAGLKVAPKDERIPQWFRNVLPPDSKHHHPSNAYKQYGALVKFPPSGGSVMSDAKGKHMADVYAGAKPVTVKGALWMRRGGFLPNHGREAGCVCAATRFDMDPYGRIFIPDIFRFRVDVVDAAGNEVVNFGSYGNMDSRGPGSPVPEPEITFGWPITVECANGRAYVADLVNRRIVAVRLEHTTEAECKLP